MSSPIVGPVVHACFGLDWLFTVLELASSVLVDSELVEAECDK